MSVSVNVVLLAGNLTRDPEMRELPSGNSVCEFRLALNERRKTASGDWVDEPVFVDVNCWGRQAETVAEYMRRGSAVIVEGRLKYEEWNGDDGKKRSKLRVTASRVQFAGRAGDGNARQDSPADDPCPPDDVPF